jgi:radical SAM protein with 4Fe4S-binding SPASM domain
MINLDRHANLLKAGYSYLRSSITGNPEIIGMPVSIGAELTNNCNLHCPHCPSGSGIMARKRGFMNIDLYDRVIKELGPYLHNINLYFQGEPMMNPKFFAFIRSSKNIKTIVSTNGHFLTEENAEKIVRSGLSKLIISLDGMDQKTYASYRINGNVETVMNGIRFVAEAKKRINSSLKVEIQFLVNRFNEHQIISVRKFAKSVNAFLSLKSMQILDKSSVAEWLPANNHFRRYRINEGKYVIKSSLPDRCARLWLNPVITWDGKVVPCCFDKNADYVMGDLNNDSFREIWDGPKYRLFRKSILTGRHMIEMCRNCTSGLRGVRY